MMRTTLDLDADVLALAKSMAEARRSTAGKIISEVFRKGLRPETPSAKVHKRNGFTLMPERENGKPVTMEMVNKLRDQTE